MSTGVDSLFLFVDWATLSGRDDICGVVGSDLLLLNEHYPFAFITGAAGLHDSHDDLLLVDLPEETHIFKDFRPVDAHIDLSLTHAEDFLVHLLVGCQHPDKVPDILRSLIVAVEQAEQSRELLLIRTEGVPGHLVLLESYLFDDLAHLLQV